ncbi:Bile acid:sodium symporter [Pirellula staleyi DSM 6068]|uniref:Bile acid:sodium symporter n=1 Tax=Pirellula staleyi (strain ATCC 27377 / DSM 6068 / ICPB 4128) TaxID=530564 RepID=D2R8V7_PIRSD|nr:Bile acid:sodium symporter [Pirellula staleyi DSM 6068]
MPGVPRATESRRAVKQFLIDRWFLIGLTVLVVVGTLLGPALMPLAKVPGIKDVNLFLVMFFMTLPIALAQMQGAISRPAPAALAVAISYGLLPAVAWGIGSLIGPSYGHGLMVASIVPCTQASAAVWTRKAGGNDSIAVLVTIVTNLSCFLVAPAWLAIMRLTPQGLDFVRMVTQLAGLVVLPMILAQIARRIGPVAHLATKYRTPLGVLVQCGLLSMVFFGAIESSQGLRQGLQTTSGWLSMLAMATGVVLLHTTMFFVGLYTSKLCGFSREDSTAVAFSGSQKTLMVGLKVAMDSGYSVLPMITYHIGQLFVDTLLADWLKRRSGLK